MWLNKFIRFSSCFIVLEWSETRRCWTFIVQK